MPFINPWDRFYGWATVQVHRSGEVTLTVQGFSDGAGFDPSTGVVSALSLNGPTTVLYSVAHLQ